ncbi:hypothetical protein F0246_17610 [Vibrio owensii]|nr:hypothetical protein [Vibrio owensii]
MKSRLQNLPQMIYESEPETNSHKGLSNKKEQRLLLFKSLWLIYRIMVLVLLCATVSSFLPLAGISRKIDRVSPLAGFSIAQE